MITLFALPKAFSGHIGVIQHNAIGSWCALSPQCQIILLGNEAGIEEAAKIHGVEWIPDVTRSKFGTPLLDSAFALASAKARHDWICYLNSDIILFNDFVNLPSTAPSHRTLFVGQRWDYDLITRIDFTAGWDAILREAVSRNGKLHPPAGSDYFLFHKQSGLSELPSFAVGRPGWDNWFIYNARKKGHYVVDATPTIAIVHQNHDYRHVPQGRGDYTGPEGDENMRIALQCPYLCTLDDATHVLNGDAIRLAISYRHLRRCFQRLMETAHNWRARRRQCSIQHAVNPKGPRC